MTKISRRALLGSTALLGTGIGLSNVSAAEGAQRYSVGTSGQEQTQAAGVRILETNAPLDGGDLLDVTAEVENQSEEPTDIEVNFFVGDQPSQGTRIVPVEPGETKTVEYLQHRTYPVEEDAQIQIKVEANGETAERTVDVRGVGELPDEVVAPSREVTVQPETSVMFEVDSDEYGNRTFWYLDGEFEFESLGPWQSWYPTDYWQRAFESAGTHEVTAGVVGETANYRKRWTVTVSPDGNAAPEIDSRRPVPDEPLEAGQQYMLELDVADSDGLDRVVWWLTQGDVLLDTTTVSGTEDTASIDFESECHTCSVVTWVLDQNNLVTSESVWTVEDFSRSQNTLTVTKENAADGRASFYIASSEGVTADDEGEGVRSQNAALDWLGPVRGTDTYTLTGQPDTFLLKGPATVRWNGQVVDPADLGSSSAAVEEDSLSQTLRIESTGTGRGYYAVTTSEGIVATDAEAVADGYSVLDHVGPARGTDEFRFGGDIVRFLSTEHVRVYVNGTEVDPSEVPSSAGGGATGTPTPTPTPEPNSPAPTPTPESNSPTSTATTDTETPETISSPTTSNSQTPTSEQSPSTAVPDSPTPGENNQPATSTVPATDTEETQNPGAQGPGFDFLAGIGGLGGVVAYLLSRSDEGDNE